MNLAKYAERCRRYLNYPDERHLLRTTVEHHPELQPGTDQAAVLQDAVNQVHNLTMWQVKQHLLGEMFGEEQGSCI